MPDSKHALADVRALTFDLLGTVIDWRKGVTDELEVWVEHLHKRLLPPDCPLQHVIKSYDRTDCAFMAQEWRNQYFAFCRSFVPGSTPWKTVEDHLRECLPDVLATRGLTPFFDERMLDEMATAWKRLRPFEDAIPGLEELGEEYIISSLSNANIDMIQGLQLCGDFTLHVIVSAETFRAYKPQPVTYEGAAAALGMKPHEVAMVAAHLSDLQAARACGMRTVYLERPEEEEWKEDEERYQEARKWVDVWVGQEEEGLVTLAQRLVGS